MKKFSLAVVIFMLLSAGAVPGYALEPGGYLENKLQVKDGQNIVATNKLKLDFTIKAETYYLCTSITGFNDFLEPNNNRLEISRAYLELYPAWGRAVIGLQNIAWGYGYLFNLPDQFNLPNPIDPKGEKSGINAISVKWNTSETSLIETVVVPAATVAGSDYGVKGLWNIGRFDAAVYALKRIQSEPGGDIDRRAAILELKGELGADLPGVWAQASRFDDIQSSGTETTYISSVFGADYTFALGNGLYVLAEYFQNGKMAGNQLYFLARYNTTGYITFSLSGLWVPQTDTALYSLILKYQLNDNVEFSAMANYYPRGSAAVGLNYSCDNEIVIGLKSSF